MARTIPLLLLVLMAILPGCSEPGAVPYGRERRLTLPGQQAEVWAVAPAINLSGQNAVDPILQADLLYQQLQTVEGITALPVNRTAEVMLSLQIDQVRSAEDAALLCRMLGADALVVPTVTIYDPYDPPKLGASLAVFPAVATEDGSFAQVAGMFDAANGTVRDELVRYAHGRHEPTGPLGRREYLASAERYCGFVYYALLERLMGQVAVAD
jgi:hypothetical protein